MTNREPSELEELRKILWEFARDELHPETARFNTKPITEVAQEKILKWHEQELTKARLDELETLQLDASQEEYDGDLFWIYLNERLATLNTELESHKQKGKKDE